MRRDVKALFVCAAVLVAVSGPAFSGPATAAESHAGWGTDFEKAQAEAKRLGLPLLVHFYADWCGPCRKMEAGVLNAPEVAAALGTKCVAVKINSDHQADLVSRFGVAGLPTDVFVNPEAGDVIGRSVGGATRDAYLARIDDAGRKFSSAPADPAGDDPLERLSWLANASGVGLDGYSPVSLTTGKLWRQGSVDFAWKHAGVVYYMADQAELDEFRADPDKYAPQYSGFDPMILSTERVAVQGDILFGSFYEGRLYLHASAENRQAFIKEPGKYPLPPQIQPVVAQKKAPETPVAVSASVGS